MCEAIGDAPALNALAHQQDAREVDPTPKFVEAP